MKYYASSYGHEGIELGEYDTQGEAVMAVLRALAPRMQAGVVEMYQIGQALIWKCPDGTRFLVESGKYR
jgi:hypothetical protein